MGQLETVVRRAIAAFEKLDGDTIMGLSSPEIQAVDEISRKWMRGGGALKDYFNSLPGQLSDVRTTLNDVHETSYGDVGLVTFWLEQDYTLGGQSRHISAPSTCVLRNDGGSWRMVLFHSIPVPEESN